MQDVKKKANQELDELFMAGSAKNLMKSFNRSEIPTTLFVIFCTGGVDFVGGYSYYQFLKNNLFNAPDSSLIDTASRKLGTLTLEEKNGDQIHEMLF